MPKLSVWMIRASLIHMGIGFLFGALILLNKGIPLSGSIWKLLPPHIELMIIGWTMQVIMGVGFFILPRFSHRPQRHGNIILGWWSFYLLNGGIALTILDQLLKLNSGLLVIGQVGIVLAIIAYVIMIWSRVKPIMTVATS